MIELKDTIEGMNSDDYKDRFRAEYFQTKIRYEKLHKIIIQLKAGKCPFTPSCPRSVLEEQARYMGLYLEQLEIRAQLEEIDLTL